MLNLWSTLAAMRQRVVIGTALGSTLLAGVVLIGGAAPTASAASCASTPTAIALVVNPTTGAGLLTASPDEARAAAEFGFTDDRGVVFYGAADDGPGMTMLHRLYRESTDDFVWIADGAELRAAVANYGYDDQGPYFAVATADDGCLVPVRRFSNGAVHRFAVTDADIRDLSAAGWADEGVQFYAGPPTAAPPPPPPPAPPATTAGAAALGAASYPIPGGAIYVATNGNDANGGGASAPVLTVNRALALAPAGGTIVIQSGRYRESVTITKQVTIQNAPGAVVWLDGSTLVTGWVASGSVWRKDGWTTRFDHSPTYVQGAPDYTDPIWRFINPSYPMAAHPDQIWIDGVEQQQVASRALVTAGTFFLDEATSQLYLGSNPTGRTVEASTIAKAVSVRAAGVAIRGIGVRRYAPSVWMVAGITLESPSARVENVVVEDMATNGLSALASDITIDRVTIRRAGMLGFHANYADRLTINAVLATGNNAERFNTTPNAGGAKVVHLRGLTVRSSDFSGNLAHGFWIDMSVYDSKFINNRFSDNTGDGLFLEISAKAVVADNLIANNGGFGMKVNNTSDVKIWNNTIVGNDRPLNIVQDSRRNTNPNDSAVDKRQPWPDPAMTWTLGPVVIANNVIGPARSSANCLLCVEDYSRLETAEQMGITANSNIYNRPTATQPTWIAVWARGTVVNPYVFTTLAAFTGQTGQETSGLDLIGAPIVDSNGVLASSVSSQASTRAQPLPADIAALVGQPTGTRQLGIWR